MQKWSRRSILAATGAGIGSAVFANAFGSSMWAAEAVKACTLTPELEEGPYYAPYELLRPNIREGRPGVPLRFALELRDEKTCAPIQGAAIDVWHCDALGIYSGFTKAVLGPPPGGGPGGPGPGGFGGPPPGGRPPGGPGGPEGPNGPPHMKRTDDETFCRGVQVTDARGRVGFETIFPGWYQGRDTHIHLEVHMGGNTGGAPGHAGNAAHTTYPTYTGGHVCHTGQIAFPDELSDEIALLTPYREHKIRRTRLKEDHVFQGDPQEYMMTVQRASAANVQAGLTGTITVFVDPSLTPPPVRMGPGGPPPPA